jgi:hypothetical protein
VSDDARAKRLPRDAKANAKAVKILAGHV